MTTTPFEDLFPGLPQIDRAWEARKERLMAMSADERVAAMRAGQLSYRELTHWSAVRPDEVPVVRTGQGYPGEFEWIAMFEPDIAEHDERSSRARDERQRQHAAQTQQRSDAGRRGNRARS
jgi:hypothetical protein